MSQRELARAAGLSPDTIRRLEGTAEAQFETLRKLAKALNVEPAELMVPEQTG
jgi:transcriptional regulator with XRE-family HTH domain